MSTTFNTYEIARIKNEVHGNTSFSVRNFLDDIGEPSNNCPVEYVLNERGRTVTAMILTQEQYTKYAARSHSVNRTRLINYAAFKNRTGGNVDQFLDAGDNGNRMLDVDLVSSLDAIAAIDMAIEELNKVRAMLTVGAK